MIHVLIEIWPHGLQSRRRTLGEAFITNDGTGTHEKGSYDVVLSKIGGQAKGIWKTGRVEGFSRLTKGAYDLLYSALKQCVGARNIDEGDYGQQ